MVFLASIAFNDKEKHLSIPLNILVVTLALLLMSYGKILYDELEKVTIDCYKNEECKKYLSTTNIVIDIIKRYEINIALIQVEDKLNGNK